MQGDVTANDGDNVVGLLDLFNHRVVRQGPPVGRRESGNECKAARSRSRFWRPVSESVESSTGEWLPMEAGPWPEAYRGRGASAASILEATRHPCPTIRQPTPARKFR
jgi:hypothetical protein